MLMSNRSTARRVPYHFWRHAVIYHVLLDRFAGYAHPELAGQPEFIGGNLKGVRAKLRYIAELADVLWLSPFQMTTAYHGYHITGFDQVGPQFGTEADLRELLGEARELGLKVICDLVPNHCGYQHPWFQAALHDRKSPFRNCFYFHPSTDRYETLLTFSDAPKLNLGCAATLDELRYSAHKWLSMGFCALRLDHVIGLSNAQTSALVAPLQAEFASALFIGEAWAEGISGPEQIATLLAADEKTIRRWIRHPRSMYRNYQGILDGVLNFEGADLLEAYARADDPSVRARLEHKLRAQWRAFRRSFLLPAHLDNHDMDRFLFRVGQDVSRLQAAARLQFSLDQPVVIYYGTEVGMTQDHSMKSVASYGDLVARQPMIWDESKQNRKLLGFYQELTAERRHRAKKLGAA